MAAAAGWTAARHDPEDNPGPLDVRTLCLTRETLARHDGLADFAFAMQGLGTGADQPLRHGARISGNG
jgi:acyl-CoA dehydrogenase